MKYLAYTTIQKVRDLTGLDTTDISGSDITVLLGYVDNIIAREITIVAVNETVLNAISGSGIDGTNTEFTLAHTPVADTNYDSSVGTDDITVYRWPNEDKEGGRVECVVTTLSPETGRIVLATAPPLNNEKLTADYSYYSGDTPDWTIVELAATYYAGYLAMVKAKGKVPVKYSVGRLRVDDTHPGALFLREAHRYINQIRNKMGEGTEVDALDERDADATRYFNRV